MLGIGGQGSYAAANHFLDMLASYRRGQGLPGLSINWGPLADVGWLARHSSVNERILRQGARALTSTQALEALGRLLNTDRQQVAVVDIDWRQWNKLSSSGLASSRLESFMQSPEPDASRDAPHDLLGTLQATDSGTRKQLVLAFLCEQVAGVLGTEATKLDPHKPLPALGVDSLMAVELQVRIRRTTDIVVPVMSLLQRQSVSDLTGLLVERLEAHGQSS